MEDLDDREARLRRVVRPDEVQNLLLDRLGLELPKRLKLSGSDMLKEKEKMDLVERLPNKQIRPGTGRWSWSGVEVFHPCKITFPDRPDADGRSVLSGHIPDTRANDGGGFQEPG